MSAHKFIAVFGVALLALALSGTVAVAEEETGVATPTGADPRFDRAPSGHPGPQAVHYGPHNRRRGPALHNAPVRSAPSHRRFVTPYGDFCPLCTNYGIGRKAVGIDHALKAMKDYFMRKGFEIRNVKGKGRFLKAEVFKDGQLVDKVLFDRRTGRVRSIY